MHNVNSQLYHIMKACPYGIYQQSHVFSKLQALPYHEGISVSSVEYISKAMYLVDSKFYHTMEACP